MADHRTGRLQLGVVLPPSHSHYILNASATLIGALGFGLPHKFHLGPPSVLVIECKRNHPNHSDLKQPILLFCHDPCPSGRLRRDGSPATNPLSQSGQLESSEGFLTHVWHETWSCWLGALGP